MITSVPLMVQPGHRHVDGKGRESRALGRLGIIGGWSFLPSAFDPLVAVLVRRGQVLPDLTVGRGQLVYIFELRKLLSKGYQSFLMEFVMMSLEKKKKSVSNRTFWFVDKTGSPTFKFPRVVNSLAQPSNLQTKDFASLWTESWCCLTFPRCRKSFPHTPHSYGLVPVCVRWWV